MSWAEGPSSYYTFTMETELYHFIAPDVQGLKVERKTHFGVGREWVKGFIG